jgi:predicted naringenin-chalcone synthase
MSQVEAAQRMEIVYSDERSRRFLRRLARQTTIVKRHLAALDWQDGGSIEPPLYLSAAEHPQGPGMGIRGRRFEQASAMLIRELVKPLPENAFTHAGTLVTVSCTHASSPGLERPLLESAPIPPAAGRWNLGFMGCSAGLAALRLVRQLTPAQQHAIVLSCELSSMHFQYSDALDQITANMLFADGAALAWLSPEPGVVALEASGCVTLHEVADQMIWYADDHGLRLELARELPDTLGACIADAVDSFLAQHDRTRKDIDHFLVHPGGPQILDSVERALGLESDALDDSRAILRDYGNMSSSTIFFIIDRVVRKGAQGRCLAMAFGPGLTIELALLNLKPEARPFG